MKSKLPRFIFTIFCCIGSVSALAQQDPTQVFENKLEAYLQHIDYLRRDSSKAKQDSLILVNTRMMAYIKKVCIQQPNTLQDEVRPSDSVGVALPGMNILTSDDNKLRVYCWDTWTGSYQRHFNSIAQFTDNGKATRIKVFNDISGGDDDAEKAGTFFSDICTVHTMLGKAVYLLMDHKVYGTKGGAHVIHAYTIDKGSLIPMPIFKTNGKLQSTVAVENDLAPYGEWAEDDANIKLTDDRKTMYVPLLKKEVPSSPRKDSVDDKKAIVTPVVHEAAGKDYYIYRFDGFHYVYDKEANRSLK